VQTGCEPGATLESDHASQVLTVDRLFLKTYRRNRENQKL
jgi:hypothetical protein